MDIERVNDYTIKFFVPFQDVEVRGFSKEEVLFQPERGEELFWEIMDELHRMDEVELESPLWIQVHVTDLGLEVVAVGIHQLNTEAFESLTEGYFDEALFEQFEKLMSNTQMNERVPAVTQRQDDTNHKMHIDEIEVFRCESFEDIIRLSAYEQQLPMVDGIYTFEGKYYLGFSLHALEKIEFKNIRSLLLEFADVSQVGWVRIQTYGKCIGKSEGLTKIQQAFSS